MQTQSLKKASHGSNVLEFHSPACAETGSVAESLIDYSRVSLIIPAKNEADNLRAILGQCQEFLGEILVIDGHSTDHSVSVAREFGARVAVDGTKGKGDALRTGAKASSRDVLVFMDADGSHDPRDIPKLLAPIFADQADLVIGSRSTGGSDELAGNFDRFLRLVGSHIILQSINWRWGTHLTDSQNGFRAIRKSTFLQLNLQENIHTIEQEMTMRCLKKGFRVVDVPAHEYERKLGSSHIQLSRVWRQYLWSWVRCLLF